jgi:hypothetical protein
MLCGLDSVVPRGIQRPKSLWLRWTHPVMGLRSSPYQAMGYGIEILPVPGYGIEILPVPGMLRGPAHEAERPGLTVGPRG